MKIIGISGKMGTGKSTLAQYLAMTEPVADWTRLAFGDVLKNEAARVFEFPVMWAYHEKMKTWIVPVKSEYLVQGKRFSPGKEAMSIREILQWWGTDVRRSLNPDYWVDQFARQLADVKTQFLVVDDVRMKNEADFIRDTGGYLVRINPYSGWVPGTNAGHISETALDKYRKFHLTVTPEFGQLDEVASLVRGGFETWMKTQSGKGKPNEKHKSV